MLSYGNRLRQQELLPDTKDSHRITDPRALKFLDNAKGPEKTLPMEFKAMASHRLGGFDMERVRVFEDPVLTGLEQPAYARGNEIHVAPGGLQTDVLMHEATHLAQQSVGHTGDLESGANRVAAGGSFAAAATPVSASAAPAQGIFGWGKRKKRKAEKKRLEAETKQQMHLGAQSHLKNQQRREIRENLHPSLHVLAPDTTVQNGTVWDPDAQITSMPTYSMEQQSHVIQGVINRNMESHKRGSDANAFAQFYYGKESTDNYAGDMGRRIEALYQTDETGGAGSNFGYNINLFETTNELSTMKAQNSQQFGKGSELTLDNGMIERLASIFRHVMAYATEYANKSDDDIKGEVFRDYMTVKRRMGEIHAMNDMLRGISSRDQDYVWMYGGYQGSAAQGNAILARVNILWAEGQREVGQGMGAQNIGNINTHGALYEEKLQNMRPSLLAQAGRQRMQELV